MNEQANAFTESIFQVGLSPINGILTRPNQPVAGPAVVILNSGLLHHIGSCRLSVLVSRQLAKLGYHAIRFDFAGIGDSPTRSDASLPEPEKTVAQLTEVFDYLQNQGIASEFLVGGLCSAADGAFHAGVVDPRVVGIFQIDPYLYRTPKYYLNRYSPDRLSISAVGRWISRRLKALTAKDAQTAVLDDTRFTPSREKVAVGYQQLIDRGVRLLVFVTGEQTLLYNYEEQFYDMFGDVQFGQFLQLNYRKDSSHMMLEPEQRNQICDTIIAWVSQPEQKT